MTRSGAMSLRLRGRNLAVVTALGLAQAAAVAAMVLVVREIVDTMTESSADPRRLKVLIGPFLVSAVAHAALRGAEFTVSERIGYRFARDLRNEMFARLQRLPARALQRRSRGGMLLRFTGDLTTIRTYVSRGVARAVVAGIVLAAGTVLMLVLDVWIAIAMLSILGLGAGTSLRAGDRLRRSVRRVRERRSALTSNIEEKFSALTAVRVFGRTAGEAARLERQNEAMTNALLRFASARGRLRGLSTASANLCVAAVLAVGGFQVAHGRATVGVMVAALAAVRHLSGPIRTLGLCHDYWQSAWVSRHKILDFLSLSEAEGDTEYATLGVPKGLVQFEDVVVRGTLRRVDAVAAPGALIAIVGPTGAGKSTLLALIARFIDPDDGRVLIDGQDLARTSATSIHRHVGMMSPDVPLMRGTVGRNLRYRRPDASDEEVDRVVRTTHLDDILSRLPGGMAHWVTDGGLNLSRGERQRLAFARAIIGNPPILLLDEPTSSVDADSAAVLRRLIARYRGTVLLATHDPAEVALADRVWVMEDGVITADRASEEYLDARPAEPAGMART